ncbi:MAG: hypothetical protein CMG63_04160 [Candidatus Marinimicrobia bacterium]|nr:hypothetical protein [Candidatus Neomarinimicrobiota bacterium]
MNWKKILVNRFYQSSNKLGYDTSLFSMIGMGVGSFAMIIALSVMNGFEDIVHKRLRGFDGDINISDISSELDFSDIPEIDLVMPYMERKGIIKSNKDNLIVLIEAINDSLMDEFYDIPYEGKFPKNGQIIIGKGLANMIDKNINEEIILFSPIDQVYGAGFPPMKKMKISGIFSTKVLNYDESYVFVTINDGKNLFKRKNTIDGYKIKTYNEAMTKSVIKKLDNLLDKNTRITSWKEKNKSLVDAMRMERKAAIIILGLIFLVSSFNLSSSLILISIKKMKEVGMMKVLGAQKKELMNVMIFLGIKTAIKGALIGLGIASFIVILQNLYEFIPLPSNVYFINFLPMKLSVIDFTLVFIIVSIFIIFSSYFAAKKIAFQNLREALEWVK